MALRFAPLVGVFIATASFAATSTPPSGADDGRFIPGADLDGTWEGILSNGGMGIPLIFVISTRVGESTRAVLDVVEQAPKDIPVAYAREKMNVLMDIPAIGGKFDGLASADLSTISGRWTQTGAAGAPVPLILHRKAP